jgi:hypothetical protein
MRRVSHRGSKQKGARGEAEVVEMFRANGYAKAARSPGSGAMRPYGAGDLSPWPGDLIGVEPFLVEVKYDERVYAQGDVIQRTWAGSPFIKVTLRALEKLADRHNGIVGGTRVIPVLFARSNMKGWRVFIPQTVFLDEVQAGEPCVQGFPDPTYVEVSPDDFFSLRLHARP